MENSGTSGGVNDAKTATTITLNIKFSGRSIPVSVSPNSTVKDLKSLLQPLTNVLTRGQKLIFKGLFPLYKSRNPRYFLKKQTRGRNWFLMVSVCAGRVLADGMTLRESEITDGAKVMLMASQGLHQGVSSLFFFFFFISFSVSWHYEIWIELNWVFGSVKWKGKGVNWLIQDSIGRYGFWFRN